MNLLAVLLVAPLVVFGASLLRGLRAFVGSPLYWIVGAVPAMLLAFVGTQTAQVYLGATLFFTFFLMVGIFLELEDLDMGPGWTSFWSVMLVLLVGGACAAFWVGVTGDTWMDTLVRVVQLPMEQMLKLNPEITITARDIIYQIPGSIMVVSMFGLFLSFLLERPLKRVFMVKTTVKKRGLESFRLPDYAIWVLLLGVMGTGFEHGHELIKAVSVNLLYLMFTLYFFQGLAVVVDFMKFYRVGPFWRAVTYTFIIVSQFSLVFLCITGVADFWLEFRKRWKKNTQPDVKREIF